MEIAIHESTNVTANTVMIAMTAHRRAGSERRQLMSVVETTGVRVTGGPPILMSKAVYYRYGWIF